MSTFNDKVEAAYEFLVNRAQLGRVTNHEELGRVLGTTLAEKRQRRINTPVRREKVIDVLRAVDDRSLSEKGVMLSALVTHFWDNGVGSRFFESATQRGVYAGDVNRKTFHKNQLAQVYAAYGNEVPDTIAELDSAVQAPLTRDEVRRIAREAAREVVDSDF